MCYTNMATQLAPNLCYKIALIDFFSLLLLPASDRSRLHGGWQRRKFHLMNRKQIPQVKELEKSRVSAIFNLVADQI